MRRRTAPSPVASRAIRDEIRLLRGSCGAIFIAEPGNRPTRCRRRPAPARRDGLAIGRQRRRGSTRHPGIHGFQLRESVRLVHRCRAMGRFHAGRHHRAPGARASHASDAPFQSPGPRRGSRRSSAATAAAKSRSHHASRPSSRPGGTVPAVLPLSRALPHVSEQRQDGQSRIPRPRLTTRQRMALVALSGDRRPGLKEQAPRTPWSPRLSTPIPGCE